MPSTPNCVPPVGPYKTAILSTSARVRARRYANTPPLAVPPITFTPFPETVRRNFQTWIMAKHAGVPTEKKFTEPQTAFLQLIRDHVMTSFRFERDDLNENPVA